MNDAKYEVRNACVSCMRCAVETMHVVFDMTDADEMDAYAEEQAKKADKYLQIAKYYAHTDADKYVVASVARDAQDMFNRCTAKAAIVGLKSAFGNTVFFARAATNIGEPAFGIPEPISKETIEKLLDDLLNGGK